MTGTDYGNYSDFMRKAYHHEPVSMNRVSDKIHIDIESPRLSICITCTPGQLPSLFPTFENGLGSRFQFYELPDEKVEFHDVFAQTDNPLEDTYKQMGEELLPLYHAMQQRVGHPIQFVLSKAQQKKFLDTYGEVLVDQFQMYGIGMNAFIFRTALANFRYAMILTALRRLSEWNKQDASSAMTRTPWFVMTRISTLPWRLLVASSITRHVFTQFLPKKARIHLPTRESISHQKSYDSIMRYLLVKSRQRTLSALRNHSMSQNEPPIEY